MTGHTLGMIARRAVALFVLLAAACSSSTSGTTVGPRAPAASTSSTTTSTSTPTSPGSARPALVVRTESFVDASRPTPVNGSAPGTPDRSIPTTIWYPANRGGSPLPLVMFVHGFALRPATYAPLLERWATAGYVVAAPAIPVLNGDAPGGSSEADLDAAPGDVEFALDQVLRLSATDGPLHGLVDPTRVAVAGHSDGESVAFALTADPCCRDPRLRGLIAFAGLLGTSGPAPLETGVPILHVIADHDRYSDYDATVAFDRDRLPGPKLTVTLVGAEHEAPFDDPTDIHFDLVASCTVTFLDAVLRNGSDATARIEEVVGASPQLAAITVRG